MVFTPEERRERKRLRDARYRETHRDACKERERAYRERKRAAIHAYQKSWRESEAGRTYYNAYTAAYYLQPANRLRNLVGGAMRRAQKAGLDFDAALRDALIANPPTNCACCGESLDYSTRNGSNVRLRSPSLDRVNISGGYTMDNVRVKCMRCTEVKRNATMQEIEHVLAYMKRHARV